MNASLLGYEAAVLAALDASSRAVVARELTELEALVATDPALRAALTDTSIERPQRRAVVADILDAKVHAATARIAAYAAFSSPAQDVPASFAEAAHRARQLVDDGELHEPSLAVLAARDRVGGFATAVLEDQEVGTFDGAEDELFSWARAVEDSHELRSVLTNRDLPAPTRAQVVADLLDGRAGPVAIRLAAYAVVGGRSRDLVGTLDWLVDRVAKERGWRVARVRTAKPIDPEVRERLAASLRSLVGHPVELEVAAQADLLGGVLIEVGDLRVDATTRRRLDAMRARFFEDRAAARQIQSIESTQGAA